MPASLNCPTCGAPASGPEATRCDYCASTLTTMGCPKCFGVMFAGMQHCPHCGAKSAREVDASATLVCPGCKGVMHRVTVGHTEMYECTACHSTWLDANTFMKLCRDREEHGAIAAMIGPGATAKKPAGGAVRYLPCPNCQRVMNRQNFGKRSGVIIDVCKNHGTWFEARELQACLAFIDSGGLEKMRAAEAEKQRAQDRADAARAMHSLNSSPMSASPSGFAFVREEKKSLGEQLLTEAINLLFS
jgi:Zn-finger nucleic acid-binding protein